MPNAILVPDPTKSPRKAAREPRGTCGLIVRITPDGKRPTLYDAKPIRPDSGSDVIKAYALTKAGSSERYDVALTIYGPQCSCRDFVYAREGSDPEGCKHCRALTKLGLL